MARLTLTFDNGPTPQTTPSVLDQLAERGIRAYFCVVGAQLARGQEQVDIACETLARGHIVVNHSASHRTPLGDEPTAEHARREIGEMRALMQDVLEPFAENKAALDSAIKNFRDFSQELKNLTGQAGASLEQFDLRMEYVTDSLVAAMGGIKPLLDEYTKLGYKLNSIDVESRMQRVDSLLIGSQELLAKLNSDEGMIGELMNNDSLYHSLNKTMVDLDSLFMDFRANPKRYVHFSLFGRKNRPPADKKKKKRKK